MLVAGFDTETTGLDLENDHIIEAGVVLWDTERKKPIVCYNSFILTEHIKSIPEEATKTNGIHYDDLINHGKSFEQVFSIINAIFGMADAVVAHNGNLFDRPIYRSNCLRYDMEPVKKLWVDTTCDVEYPASITTRKLSYLAAEHGFLNPFAHRSLFDVLTMLKVASHYDWEKIIAWAKSTTLVVQAIMPFDKNEMFNTKKSEFEAMKAFIKLQGFKFDYASKTWVKSIKEFDKEKAKEIAVQGGYVLSLIRKEEPENA